MNIPILPTDSLYKFVALAGLVLLLFGLTYPVQNLYRIQLQIAEAQTQVEMLRSEAKNAKDDFKLLVDANTGTLADRLALRRRLHEIEYQAIKVQGQVNKTRLLNNQLFFMLFVCGASCIAGLRLSWWGFARWYFRIQRPSELTN